MPDDLVGDPVEDIEDEEGQGEGRPGDGVYPLGSVHKLLPHGVHVFGDRRRRVRGRGGVFDGRAVLGRRGLTHVAGKIKAAFADVFILRNMTPEHKRVNVEATYGGISHSATAALLPGHHFTIPIFCRFNRFPEDAVFTRTKQMDVEEIVGDNYWKLCQIM